MKNKIKNILKYISIPIIATLIFFITLSAQAEQIKYNQLFTNLSTINFGLGWDSASYVETINNIEFIDSGNQHYLNLNYDIDVSNFDFITLDFTQKNKLNSNYQFIAKLNGYTGQFAFINDTNREYLINTNNMNSNGDVYYYNINETFEYNKLVIYTSNTNNNANLPLITMNTINNEEIFANGYENGYNDAYQYYTNLQTQYNLLEQNYRTLQQQYRELAEGEYTFENLFWSVGAVPMAFLLQGFNVNVLGLNLRAIITGLITALVIIYLIKKLIK